MGTLQNSPTISHSSLVEVTPGGVNSLVLLLCPILGSQRKPLSRGTEHQQVGNCPPKLQVAWEVAGGKEILLDTNSIYDTIIIPDLEMRKFEIQ